MHSDPLPPRAADGAPALDARSPVVTPAAPAKRPGPIRRLYDWTIGWADRPGGTRALFALAFAESSFFPIPPDVLLMALCIGRPRRALWFATVCTVASVLGGILGYAIGYALFEQLGRPLLEAYGIMDKFDWVGQQYRDNLVLALGTAGFTPVPYKLFTIAGGAFQVAFVPFVLVSLVSRGARFFLVAGLIRVFGPSIKTFIDRYFNLLTVAFVVLLVLGFVVVKLVLPAH